MFCVGERDAETRPLFLCATGCYIHLRHRQCSVLRLYKNVLMCAKNVLIFIKYVIYLVVSIILCTFAQPIEKGTLLIRYFIR